MAEVDFSNAIIEPDSRRTTSPVADADVSLNLQYWYDDTQYVGECTRSKIVNEQKQIVYQYQGAFTQSGTYFYMDTAYNGGWKISNISFNNGDTCLFTINATLTCN